MNKKLLLLAGLIIWLGTEGFPQKNPVADVLIKNAHIITITNGTLEDTDVLIQDGIIKEIGANLKAKKTFQLWMLPDNI